WLPGLQTTPTILVSPVATTTYGVILTDGSGCRMRGAVTIRPTALLDPACLAPTVVSISPRSGSIYGGTAVAVTGSKFQLSANLLLGIFTANESSVPDPEHIEGTTPFFPSVPAGVPLDVTVVNPDSSSAALRRAFLIDFSDVPPEDQFHDAVVHVAL